MTTIQDRIQGRLSEMGITYYALAKSAGISYRTVYSLMNGENKTRPKIIGSIAAALQVSPGYLLTGEGFPEPVRRPSEACESGSNGHKHTQPDRAVPELTMRDVVRFLARQFGVTEEQVMSRMIKLLSEEKDA